MRTANARAIDYWLEVVKDKMVERLVLEAAMEEGFIRCVLFFVGFIAFIMMVYTAYPADELLPVHEVCFHFNVYMSFAVITGALS